MKRVEKLLEIAISFRCYEERQAHETKQNFTFMLRNLRPKRTKERDGLTERRGNKVNVIITFALTLHINEEGGLEHETRLAVVVWYTFGYQENEDSDVNFRLMVTKRYEINENVSG